MRSLQSVEEARPSRPFHPTNGVGHKQSKQMPNIANIWPQIPPCESRLPIPAAAEELRGPRGHSGELGHPPLAGPVQPRQLAQSHALIKEKANILTGEIRN